MKDSFLKTQEKILLQWKNLSLIDKKSNKYILDNLQGKVQSGQFLTIMGPSGAGKSSFLSIITSKLSSFGGNFNIKGKTLINGEKYSEQQLISISSYVPQDDLLLQTLTVKCSYLRYFLETLDFQAKLKLSALTQQQRQQRVEQVLKILNLFQIKNSYVGGKTKKSISGGQKKRVVIGVELISNPSILILDQPTSGLDSFNSLKIINILSDLAKKQNKLVIATIHQPSTLMFRNFDKLMVLKGGKQVYHQQSHKIVSYMESLNIKVDYRMNPADFFMLQLSSYKQLQGHTTRFTSQAFQQYKRKQKAIQIQNYSKIDFNDQTKTPLIEQFAPLLIRNFKNFVRCPSNQFGRLMQMICYPIFIGTLYYDVIDNIPNIANLQQLENFLSKFSAFMFLGLFFTLGQTIYDTMLVFPAQKQLVMKEVHSNMYSLNIYYITKLIIELPGMLIPIWIATTIVYFVVGLQNSFGTFIYYEFVFSLSAIAGYKIGIITGTLCKQQQYAVQASPFIVTILVLFGGLVVNLNTIPSYSSWMQYISPIKYGFDLLMTDHLNTDKLYHMGQYQFIRDKLGITGHVQQNLINFLLLIYILIVLSFLVLYIRRKFN